MSMVKTKERLASFGVNCVAVRVAVIPLPLSDTLNAPSPFFLSVNTPPTAKKEWVALALIELEAFVLERLTIEKQVHLGLGSGDGHGDDLAVLARKV